MKKIFTFFAIFFISISSAYAACDFIIDIGDKKTKFVERFTEPFPQFEGLFMLPVPSPEICPNDNLDQDIAVEYIFLGENLASIRMLVFNDENNSISNNLLLMNYAKKNFGDFDTGENPLIYNSFQSWEIGGKIIVYKRLADPEGFIEEEIYISNDEYDYKLGKFYNQLEEVEDGKPEEQTE